MANTKLFDLKVSWDDELGYKVGISDSVWDLECVSWDKDLLKAIQDVIKAREECSYWMLTKQGGYKGEL